MSDTVEGIQNVECVRRFARCCTDGWLQGWHERNGGNLTYRLTPEDVDACAPFFYGEAQGAAQNTSASAGAWVDLGIQAPSLGGQYFLSTGSGKYMRNVADELSDAAGIVELNADGSAYRVVWGLENGGKPTSELPTHVMNHAVRAQATDGANRVIYHAHCPNVIALSTLIAPGARQWTRILWKSMTECIVVFPDGVGVVPWMVPGGADIARATSQLMDRFAACVWTQHGLFGSGASFDEAFGLMHTIEKSAMLYLVAKAANGGAEPAFLISDDELRAVCNDFNVQPADEFLDGGAQ